MDNTAPALPGRPGESHGTSNGSRRHPESIRQPRRAPRPTPDGPRRDADGSHDAAGATPNGSGFLASSGAGYGLRGIAGRVALLGGHVEAGPTTEGWRVEAVVPLASDAEAQPIQGVHGVAVGPRSPTTSTWCTRVWPPSSKAFHRYRGGGAGRGRRRGPRAGALRATRRRADGPAHAPHGRGGGHEGDPGRASRRRCRRADHLRRRRVHPGCALRRRSRLSDQGPARDDIRRALDAAVAGRPCSTRGSSHVLGWPSTGASRASERDAHHGSGGGPLPDGPTEREAEVLASSPTDCPTPRSPTGFFGPRPGEARSTAISAKTQSRDRAQARALRPIATD